MALVAIAACSRGEEAKPAPTPEPVATKSHVRVNASGLEIESEDATVIVDGFQFFIQPIDPDMFEIDADATQFVGYAPMLVDFGVTALNGTPPVTYTWNFGDGSEPATGNRVSHIFEKTGRIDIFVMGKDSAGDEATVQLAMNIFSREDWATARQVDVDSLPTPTPRP